MTRVRRGMSLLEVLIGAVLLGMIAVPIFSLLWTSKSGVDRATRHRDARYLSDVIFTRAQSTDFMVLYANFGANFDGKGCIASPTAIDSGLGGDSNPLKIDDWVTNQLRELGWEVKIKFRFLTKKEVEMQGKLKSATGILHLQAGVLWFTLSGSGIFEEIKKVVYCPMILGRPGLDLQQCPAVNLELVQKFEGMGYP